MAQESIICPSCNVSVSTGQAMEDIDGHLTCITCAAASATEMHCMIGVEA